MHPEPSHLNSGKYPTKLCKHQRILTSKLFQVGRTGETLDNPWMRDAILVLLKSNGRILDVRPTNDEDLAALASSDPSVRDESKADVLDLRGLTILPGFIDTHVHCKCEDPFISGLPLTAFFLMNNGLIKIKSKIICI
jgi:N-acyl-D-aspartate/D-glutamate deacylase